ncbi:MAG: glutamate-1-semialdehyde 2,1-aminomutase [Pseudobdellovibrionaceae bacterium]
MLQKSEELFERAKKVAPGGVHSPVRSFKGLGRSPIFFTHAKGPYLHSVEKKKYTDFCMSFGPLILGHQDPEVKAAVLDMVHTAWSFGACEVYSLELAEWMTSQIPWAEKVRFVSSGTEAVMSAIRVARAATGRTKILKFDGCYHGHLDGLLVQAGSGLAGEASTTSAGIPEEIAKMTLVCPLDDEKKLEEIFELHGHEIALCAIEPLPANNGLLPQRQEFLQRCADLSKEYGSLLLFDEVISGFRVGLGGMVEKTGIIPDLVCYGKIIGGGFPVGCYAGRKDLMDQVAPLGKVYQAGTLSANPIGMRAGLITLKKLQRENVWKTLEHRLQRFTKEIKSMFDQKGLDLQIVQHSSLFWITPQTKEPIRRLEQIPTNLGEEFKSIFIQFLNQGVYLAPNAYEVGFLSLAHTESVLDEALESMKMGLRSI